MHIVLELQLRFTVCLATLTVRTMTVWLETLLGTATIQETQHTLLLA
jgi:hypothetical protein